MSIQKRSKNSYAVYSDDNVAYEINQGGQSKSIRHIWGGVGVFYGPNLKSIVILFYKKKVGVIFFTSI